MTPYHLMAGRAVALARPLPASLIAARAEVFNPLTCLDLNVNARRVLFGILTFVNARRLSKEIFPRRDTLRAEALLQSDSTLYRGLALLEEKGYITRNQTRRRRCGTLITMSISRLQAQRAAAVNLDDMEPTRPGVKVEARTPRTAPGQLMDLQSRYREALATIERLSKGGVPMEVELSRLIRVPGRQRPLTPEERAELKANLDANPLIHPVTILPETSDGFELLSGYNRAELYEELGRTKIPAVVIDVPKETADVLAFYANLAPALPDYKIRGPESPPGDARFRSDGAFQGLGHELVHRVAADAVRLSAFRGA